MTIIPAETLKNHIAILGKTGSGKSATGRVIVENVVANDFRVCILDSIKSDWWGITSSADGKRPGLPFKILGGPRGHVPLHSSAGKVIGQLVGSGKLPLSIIDMADFEAGGLQRFFVDFAQSLMRNARGVIYLVIEEAHEFAPKERRASVTKAWRCTRRRSWRKRDRRRPIRGAFVARSRGNHCCGCWPLLRSPAFGRRDALRQFHRHPRAD